MNLRMVTKWMRAEKVVYNATFPGRTVSGEYLVAIKMKLTEMFDKHI